MHATPPRTTGPTRRTAPLIAAGLALGALAASGSAGAQGWAPSKPVTLVVPFAAGGPSDVVGRLVAEAMGRIVGQTIVVENVAGAGGSAGAARLARAEPDGHTLLIHHLALAAAPHLYAQLPYDTKTAFAPVGLVNTGPMILVGKTALPDADAPALFARLRAAQGAGVSLAHAGNGSNSHLCAVLMGGALGMSFNMVPYRGTGPAMNDLVAGQVDLTCDQSTTAVPQVQARSVKAFAVTSATRLPTVPDVPTMAEAGLPAVDMTIWHGLYAPAGTPAAALDAWNAALRRALAEPGVREKLAATGTSTFPDAEMTRAAHAARFAAEIERWGVVLRQAGLRPGAAQ